MFVGNELYFCAMCTVFMMQLKTSICAKFTIMLCWWSHDIARFSYS